MLKIRRLSEEHRAKHLELMGARFNSALDASINNGEPLAPYADDLFHYLRNELENILVGSPSQLVKVINYIQREFREFHRQCSRKRAKKPSPKLASDARTVSVVEECFDYDAFAKKGLGWGAYLLVKALDVRVCPYCQLHHVNYHLPETNQGFALRPPLDHYYPRTTYPYLAVSLSNLIPCCTQCNSSIKLSLDPLKGGLPHPGDVDAEVLVSFTAQGTIPVRIGGNAEGVRLTIEAENPASEAHVAAFRLAERYQWYRHEIFDLMEQFDRVLDIPQPLRRIISQDAFVLGFDPSEANKRALGLCLVDIYEELKTKVVA